MSQNNDIAGSDDVISLNYESQETFTEHSYRMKQSTNRIEKNPLVKDQLKENQKPIEQPDNEELDGMQTDAQNCLLSTQIDEVPVEEPTSLIDNQTKDNPFVFQPPAAPATLTDESNNATEKDLSSADEQTKVTSDAISKTKSVRIHDSSASTVDASTTGNNLRLYISPSTSLLETTSEDAQPTEEKNQPEELDNKPKDEPMDTNDAQASLVVTEPTKVSSPKQKKLSISPASKALYSLSQPATNKFESILAKLTNSPARRTSSTNNNDIDEHVTVQEEEELYIKETVSKILRRYSVKVDQNGRTLSRELLSERTVEENTTTRVESWPPVEKKTRRSTVKNAGRPSETTRKKPVKTNVPKRKAKSLKPTSNTRKSKIIQSDDDDDVSKSNTNDDSTDDEEDNKKDTEDDEEEAEEKEEDDTPTDDVSGDEFIPTQKSSTGQSLKKGLRVFAKWVDGHFYPGAISNISGEKYMIEFDDGAKRYVKANDIVPHGYLEVKQSVLAQTQDGFFETGIIKRLIKKKKTGKLGYIVEKDGKEKWYPLRFISLTCEQAEKLSGVINNTEAPATTNVTQGKRKRTLTAPQSPNKKTKSSVVSSPNKNPRTTFTPTRQTKLFNAMCFLITGFNDSMDVRQKIHESIESHGGKVVEKMPPASRRDNAYLISDIARKTAKFFDAKRLNVPCVNYEWINECIAKSEIQECDKYKLFLPEKETKMNEDNDVDENKD